MEDALNFGCLAFQMAVLVFLLVRAARNIRCYPGSLPMVFMTFSIATYLLSDLYWMAFTIMKSGARVLFMPSEIGDDGVLLLLGAAAYAVFSKRKERSRCIMIAAAVFAAANTALWIAWSGEWVKDLIGAFPFAYLIYYAMRALRLSGALGRTGWMLLGSAGSLAIVLEAAVLFFPQPVSSAIDAAAYAVLFLTEGALVLKTVRAMDSGVSGEAVFGLAAGLMAWSLCALYMSSNLMWYAADILTTIAISIMFAAVERLVPRK